MRTRFLLLVLAVHWCLALAPVCAQERPARVTYNHPGLAVDLGVGLWAWPLPADYDGDGDLDLLVSCPDTPYNGTYFFENPGGGALPVFKAGVRLGDAIKNGCPSYVDGKLRVLKPAEEVALVPGHFGESRTVYPTPDVHEAAGRVRAQQWKYVDFDGDGALDLVAGIGDWADYGWDNAYNGDGVWTNGPLHGYVYLMRRLGGDAASYEAPRKIEAGGAPVDVYGMPSPNFADFDGDGDLDLLCGEFVDGFTYFENTGARTKPRYAAGRALLLDGQPLRMELCMIVPVAVDWDGDGDTDLIVGQEDGRVAFLAHTGAVRDGLPVFAAPVFFQQEAADVKCGALVTPVSFDWDGDGDEDLVAGNTAGFICFIENLDGGNPPRWGAPVRLQAGGETIRIEAGINGSIQGPCERKWGYTTISVADWDHDGMPDIVANSIWGKVIWYRNTGTRTAPALAAAAPLEVAWPGAPPKPAWTWWEPEAGTLATQWRTTPLVIDWNGDGLNDLVMLDHEGYLALFARERRDGALTLLPGQRVFVDGDGAPLRLNDGIGGKSGRRKLCATDWDGDGRLDLMVNSASVDFLRNVTGSGPPWVFEDQGPVTQQKLAGHTTSPTTVDWDGNGVRDLLIGAEDGHLYYMENSTPAVKPSASRKPNIVFICTDDQAAWTLGISGNAQAYTPHMDRLAREGAYLKNAFITTPVCSPSRASIMTSRYASEFGILDFIPNPGHKLYDANYAPGLPPSALTFAEVLANAGYATGLVGKWHLGDWTAADDKQFHPANQGFGYFMGLTGGGTTPENPELEEDGVVRQFEGLTTDILTDRAIGFIERNAAHPFLLCLNYRAPHGAWLPVAPEDWVPYAELDPEIPEPDYPGLDVERVKQRMREYLASVSGVDRNLGRVLDALEAMHLTRDTIVIFFSDHGYNMGHNGIEHKGNGIWITKTLPPATENIASKYRPNLYDTSLRAPALVKWPGVVKPGTVVEENVTSLDWFPTLLRMAGAVLPPGALLRGRDLTPLLRGEQAPGWDEDIYAEYSMINYCRAFMRCYRTPEWKLVRDFLNPERDELYHLTKDPGEHTNLMAAGTQEYVGVIARLDGKIRERMAALGDPLLREVELN